MKDKGEYRHQRRRADAGGLSRREWPREQPPDVASAEGEAADDYRHLQRLRHAAAQRSARGARQSVLRGARREVEAELKLDVERLAPSHGKAVVPFSQFANLVQGRCRPRRHVRLLKLDRGTRMKSFLCASVVATLLVRSPAGAQYPEGHWQNYAPYPQADAGGRRRGRQRQADILGAYGANAPGGLAGWLNEYDPATDKWTKKTDIPMPVHHQAMTGFRDKVCVFGGGVKISPTSDNCVLTNRVWEFTPATNAWRELGPMPTKRGGGIALVMNNRIWSLAARAITRRRPMTSRSARTWPTAP